MHALLDTNMLYYLSGVSKSDIDPRKLLSNLRSLESFRISELAILEMYVHFRENKDIVRNIINFIANNKIGLDKILDQKYTLIDPAINSAMQNVDIINYVIYDSLRIKKEIENGYLRFWTLSISSILAANMLARDNPNGKPVSSTFLQNYFDLVSSLSNEKSSLSISFKNALDDFYLTEETALFKDTVKNIILDTCEMVIGLLATEMAGKDFKSIVTNYDTLTEGEKKGFIRLINNEKIFEDIDKNRSGRKPIVRKEMEGFFSANLGHYESALSGLMPIGECKYVSIMFTKFFSLENKKISKNDIIDSLFMRYYPHTSLITYDKQLLLVMKELDNSYYDEIIKFEISCT